MKLESKRLCVSNVFDVLDVFDVFDEYNAYVDTRQVTNTPCQVLLHNRGAATSTSLGRTLARICMQVSDREL